MAEIHPLLVNVEQYDAYRFEQGEITKELAELDLILSKVVIETLPEYFGDPHLFMRAPADLMHRLVDDTIVVVTARQHTFTTKYTLELAQDMGSVYCYEDVREQLINTIGVDLVVELRDLWKDERLAAVCPYMPVIARRGVDPTSYQPLISFHTRYGVIS